MVDTGAPFPFMLVGGKTCLLLQKTPTEKSSTGGTNLKTPGFTKLLASGLETAPIGGTGVETSSGGAVEA